MSRGLAALLLLGTMSVAVAQTDKSTEKTETPEVAVLEKTVVDAPGPVGCWMNNSGDRLIDCETREKGLIAFKKLYETDKTKAVAALQKRFDEIPSPKGGYFPILAAVQVKDKAFVPMLKKLADAQKENVMNVWATEAISVIETGKCTKKPPVPTNLREICL